MTESAPDLALVLRVPRDGRRRLCQTVYGIRSIMIAFDPSVESSMPASVPRVCNRLDGHRIDVHCDHDSCNHRLED